jgi:ribonuclease E
VSEEGPRAREDNAEREPAPELSATPVRENAAAYAENAPVAEAQPAVATVRARRQQPASSEPRLERVVVGPDPSQGETTGATEANAGEAKTPARKGWWQRRFGDG